MMNIGDLETIVKIVKRAKNIDGFKLMTLDNELSMTMDLQFTHELFNLRLEELLNADDFNFAHDIIGIHNNFNRVTLEMDNCFLPRYSNNGTVSEGE